MSDQKAEQTLAESSDFHMGQFVKKVLDSHHIKYASVARALGISAPSLQGYFTSKSIQEAVLRKLSSVLWFDLFGMVQDEAARRLTSQASMAPEWLEKLRNDAPVSRTDSPITRNSLVIYLEEYDDDTQLEIVRFLHKLPLRQTRPRDCG